MKRHLLRQTDSNCLPLNDVASSLLDSLMSRNYSDFEATISFAELEDINKFHEFPYRSNCLSLACERGLTEFVSLLLDAGADPNLENPHRSNCPIHICVQKGHSECLKLLIQNGADVNAKEQHADRTALHILVANWAKDGESDRWWTCLDILLSHPDIDVNAMDKDETTALELSARKRLDKIAKKLLQAGAVINSHSQQAMQVNLPDVLEEFGGSNQDPTSATENNNPSANDSHSIERELWTLVKQNDIRNLQSKMDSIRQSGASLPNFVNVLQGGKTMLQYCCEENLEEAVGLLLDAGADPNQRKNEQDNPPLLMAASHGRSNLIRLLMNGENIQMNVRGSGEETVLHKVAKQLSENIPEYLECLRILLRQDQAHKTPERHQIDINAQDVNGNTALHYAAHSGCEEAVVELLNHGAHFGLKNIKGQTSIDKILPSTLETFLDSCIQTQNEPSSSDFSIKFDYSFLAPPIPINDSDVSITVNQDQQMNDERNVYPEAEALWHLSRSSRHQYLIKHPVITSFLMLKWHNIKTFYYLNVTIYSLTVLFLTAYLLLLNSGLQWQDVDARIALDALWWILLPFIVVLFLREFLQMGSAFCRYLFTLENYIEMVMLISTAIVMAHWDQPEEWRHLSAVAVLLAWMELLLLLGRHPQLSTFIAMLTTVSKTFLGLLLWYSVLLLGFGFSFFLVFHSGARQEKGESSTNKDEKESAFSDIPSSMLKLLVMMTGEIEFGDLPFSFHPFTSRAIFIAFLFLITVVLLNLLNGMAVSDTQHIQNKAEIIGYVSRVDLISYLESMLLGDPFHFLGNWPPFSWIRRCPSASLPNLMRVKRLKNFFSTRGTVLFYGCLPKKYFKIYPNSKTAYAAHTSIQSLDRRICQCHAKFRLDGDIVQRIILHAQEKQLSDDALRIQRELKKINKAMQILLNQNRKLLQRMRKADRSTD